MPIVAMPDGTDLEFPESMSREEMRSAILSKYPASSEPESEAEKAAKSLTETRALVRNSRRARMAEAAGVPAYGQGLIEAMGEAVIPKEKATAVASAISSHLPSGFGHTLGPSKPGSARRGLEELAGEVGSSMTVPVTAGAVALTPLIPEVTLPYFGYQGFKDIPEAIAQGVEGETPAEKVKGFGRALLDATMVVPGLKSVGVPIPNPLGIRRQILERNAAEVAAQAERANRAAVNLAAPGTLRPQEQTLWAKPEVVEAPEGMVQTQAAWKDLVPKEFHVEVTEGIQEAVKRIKLAQQRAQELGADGKLPEGGQEFQSVADKPGFLLTAEEKIARGEQQTGREQEKTPVITESTPIKDVEQIVRTALEKKDWVEAVSTLAQTKAEVSEKIANDLLGVGKDAVPLSAAEKTIFDTIWDEAVKKAGGEPVTNEVTGEPKLRPEPVAAEATETVKPEGTAQAEGESLFDWADRILAQDPRTKTRMLLDPVEQAKMIAALAVKGAQLLANGARDFATWSKAMLEAHGGEIKPFLRKIYDASQKTPLVNDRRSSAEVLKTPTAAEPARPAPPAPLAPSELEPPKAVAEESREDRGSFTEYDDDMAFARVMSAKTLNAADIESFARIAKERNAPIGVQQYFADLLDWHRVKDKIGQLRGSAEPQLRTILGEKIRTMKRGDAESLTQFRDRMMAEPEYRAVSEPYESEVDKLQGLLDDVTERFGEEGNPGYATSMYDLVHILERASERKGLRSPDQKLLSNQIAADYQKRHGQPKAKAEGERGPQSLGIRPQIGPLAKAGAQTVGGVLDYYTQPLTERLAAAGGTAAKGFANMAKEITQRAKELFGSLTDTLDPALEATGKLNKATTWLNDIAPTTQKWGYRNAVNAVEGPIANVPAEYRPTVDLIKAANLQIGQLPQSVVPGFKATGKYQRAPTAFLVDTIRSGKGPAYDLLVQALSSENAIPAAKVRNILKEIKADWDAPGSQATVHKIAQEFERHFNKFPTDLKVSTPLGEIWTPILHAKPFEYLSNAASRTAQRVAFLERVPQGTLAQIREQVVPELKSPEAFDDLTRALHGLPVNEPLRMFPPGSVQGMVASAANRVLGDVFSALKLTASAIYNIPETILGNTPSFAGWRNFLQGAATLPARRAALESMGAINRTIYNWSFDPKAPIRSTMQSFRLGLRKATAQQFFNELQEMLAASTAQVFAERAQGKTLSPHEQALFTETASAMGFSRPAAQSMARGAGTLDQYGDFTRRAAAFQTGGNIQPAEMSRFGGNRVLGSLFRFQSYPMMKLNAFRKAYGNVAEAIESGDKSRITASSEQLAKFLFNTTAQGAAGVFLASLLTGRGGGVKQTAQDAEDHPGRFIFDSVAGGMGGPVAAINYAVGSGRGGDILDPRKINAGSTFPGSIYLELKEMFNRQGPYAGLTLEQAAKKYSRTKIPAGKIISHALAESGLLKEPNAARNNLFRVHDDWLKDNPDPKVKADYERNEQTQFSTSKYRSLDLALASGDDSTAQQAIDELRKTESDAKIFQRFVRGKMGPLFHESRKLETKFVKSLTADQQKLYEQAKKDRSDDFKRFQTLWARRARK